ncbi:unnamed protein product [Brassicogethes aeneus]|uniref:UBX domain-containing protein 1 n=1 Tax=Brassicogethes aeneus TaxID=1431903 RepID=A0A9P0FI17_BRAAE|nr:unnamed protein product [Brassicogethes aeneus]
MSSTGIFRTSNFNRGCPSLPIFYKKNASNMSNVVDSLVEMGFPKDRAELAIKSTGSQDLQVVMEWLLSNEDVVDESDSQPQLEPSQAQAASASMEQNSAGEEEKSDEAALVAKSIRCDDCGKLFKNSTEVEFHAAKSGHENFSESTDEKRPLTDEEKKEQLAKIEAKLKQRRMEREAKEKEEAILKEKYRIKSGKEMLEAKKKHEELEMKKILELRKREKEEERAARQRVKEQIEQDKLARKAKFAGGSADSVAEAPVAHAPVAAKTAAPVNYEQCKIQIRLIDGSTLTQTFGAKEPLSAVRLYVEINRKDAMEPFKLQMSYPRKVFTAEDYDKPLDTLGLAPTATLIVTKT